MQAVNELGDRLHEALFNSKNKEKEVTEIVSNSNLATRISIFANHGKIRRLYSADRDRLSVERQAPYRVEPQPPGKHPERCQRNG